MNVFTLQTNEKIEIDAEQIVPCLYQGSVPPTGEALRLARFSVLVLAAWQYQPKSENFPGVRVIHAPFSDSLALTESDIEAYMTTAFMVAREVRNGSRVLVTCLAGKNRSGMINALAIRNLFGVSGSTAMNMVRDGRKREEALSNATYQQFLMSLPRKS
jgi:protein-tyrosine phosphatase